MRIRATGPGTAKPLFLGIALTAAATGYLSGVPYTTVTDLGGNIAALSHPGTATPRAPQLARIWSAQVSGRGTQALTWAAREGDWTVVVMNGDGTAGLTVRADAGVTVPALPWIAAGLLAGGVLLALGGVLLIVLPARRASLRPGHA